MYIPSLEHYAAAIFYAFHIHNCTDESKRGQSMMVLCEQELLAFDLQAPK